MAASSKISWREDPSRADLIALCDNAAPSDFVCTRFLFPMLRGNALVDALDTYVDELLLAAGAIDNDHPPHVWLSKVAKLLNADLFWIEEARSPNYRAKPSRYEQPTTSRQRGRIAPGRDGRWKIIAGRKHERRCRSDVAHELGHAALYTRDGQINYEAWQYAGRTKLEECICNYIARRLLAPPALTSGGSVNSNTAVHIVENYAARFSILLSQASLCWLDGPSFSERSLARELVILWRQYHPLDYNFLHWITKSTECCFVREHLLELQACLQPISKELTFSDGWEFWRTLNSTGQPPKQLLAGTNNRLDLYIIAKNLLLAIDQLPTERRQRLWQKLTGEDIGMSFRPDWFAWRSQPMHAFVPCKRGGCRSNSLAHRLGSANGKASEIGIEKLNIAKVSGSFESHGFAHGDAAKGTRYMIQVFREIT